MVKYAQKLMTHDMRGKGDQRVFGNIMALPEQTFTVAANSWGGGGKDGSYQVSVNGRQVLVGSGTLLEPGRVTNMLTTSSAGGQDFYSDATTNRTTGVSLVASAQLSAVEGALLGMSIYITSATFTTGNPVQRLITSYDPVRRVVGVTPVIDETILAGFLVEIRPNFYPGDVITVRCPSL